MNYLDIASEAPVKKKNYLDIANTAPTKQEISSNGVTEADKIAFREHPFIETGKLMGENFKSAVEGTTGAVKTMANVGLFGLPEIASQKLTGKHFVTENVPEDIKAQANIAGFALGGPAKLAEKVGGLLPKTVGFLPSVVRGATEGVVAMGSQLPSPEEAKTLDEAVSNITGKAAAGAITGGILGGGGYVAGKGLSKIRDYAGNKVTAIRQGYKPWRDSEYQAYDEGITKLPKEPLEGADVIQGMERKMVERGLMNADGTFNKALSTADSKLLKSYERLYRKYANEGQLSTSDVIDEYQSIKGKFTKNPTPNQIADREVAGVVLDSAKPQFTSGAFEKINARYSKFKQQEELIDKYFGVKGRTNELLTGKGERFITRGMGATKEARVAANLVKEKTGQSLKGGQVLSGLHRLQKNPIARTGAAIGLGLTGINMLSNRGRRQYQ